MTFNGWKTADSGSLVKASTAWGNFESACG